MSLVLHLDEVGARHRHLAGGKGYALAVLQRHGIPVPPTLIVTTRAYEEFVAATGLRGRILLELRRKSFQEMRWEEIWDLALRLRHLFHTTPLPPDLAARLRQELAPHLPERSVVRSSAPGEDSRQTSFAGLHASFANVAGLEAVLEHLKLVWASLWSDAALLYRRELGLDVRKSAMAVLIQEMVVGDRSGVAFGQNPQDPAQAVVEAVYGLNQGLVDGTVEPDRWLLDRATGQILAYRTAPKGEVLLPGKEGVRLAELAPAQRQEPPLNEAEVLQIYRLVRRCEEIFGAPQDVEWTFKGGQLVALQSRPISTPPPEGEGDQRPWYLSLRRSFGNLKALRRKVEEELLPAMNREAEVLAAKPLKKLDEAALKEEVISRSRSYRRWKKVCWDDFIPLAHGVRLFGQIYNDAVKPRDPYEFLDLLGAAGMLALRRNRLLMEMAARVREQPELLEEVRRGQVRDPELQPLWRTFMEEFGDLACGSSTCGLSSETLASLLEEMAHRSIQAERFDPRKVEDLQGQFLSRFSGEKRVEMAQYLELARASYRLRDDDNLYLGKIAAQFLRALEEYRRRGGELRELPADVQELGGELTATPAKGPGAVGVTGLGRLKARQLIGQPASPGLARGSARVVLTADELFQFRAGEVLVCDALDPSMTLVVPLAAGIVERRGGMLIHGSIIAREYGIPCVTGVPRATRLIHTGDPLTVDGYLGIVILG
ncbi:MAG: PEP/pyruvate-binding domain-containing protein [Desulfobaccales bacterium]